MEDFSADGAQDLALVTNGGRLIVWLRDVLDAEQALGVRLVIAPGVEHQGPVRVTVRDDVGRRSAWNVAPGTPGAFAGLSTPGELVLTWRLPGGVEQTRKVTIEKGTLTVPVGR